MLIAVAAWMNQVSCWSSIIFAKRSVFCESNSALAAKAKGGRTEAFGEDRNHVTPETLLAWHRKLIAWKSGHRLQELAGGKGSRSWIRQRSPNLNALRRALHTADRAERSPIRHTLTGLILIR